ncbi:hypothetical protein H6P81_005216 [Aristolochia fimbriata]|uniref:Uncharacterized protein n=1 Tax=Aristolochia fimbriata TaxID=158543 RepID=A0AAV7EXF9_ARIFI|nr:hypothetical protein H6P81_005216 [Aristolochia fimbriata]
MPIMDDSVFVAASRDISSEPPHPFERIYGEDHPTSWARERERHACMSAWFCTCPRIAGRYSMSRSRRGLAWHARRDHLRKSYHEKSSNVSGGTE